MVNLALLAPEQCEILSAAWCLPCVRLGLRRGIVHVLQGLPIAKGYAEVALACRPVPECFLIAHLIVTCRVDAGKVELDGAQYLGFRLPFTISQLCWIEAILVGGAEVYRNGELNSEKRIYPGVLNIAMLKMRLGHVSAGPHLIYTVVTSILVQNTHPQAKNSLQKPHLDQHLRGAVHWHVQMSYSSACADCCLSSSMSAPLEAASVMHSISCTHLLHPVILL